jgi:hypothetical protein
VSKQTESDLPVMESIRQALQLSVVVAIVSDTMSERADTTHLRGCLEALHRQINPPPMEVIVPYHPRTAGIDSLRTEFPTVTFLCADDLDNLQVKGDQQHHQALRARGVACAHGDIVGLVEDVGHPDPHWCSEAVAVHQLDYAAVGGAIENGIDRSINWAVYFCDFGRYQNPLDEGSTAFASDANITYKRRALDSVRPIWEQAFHEPDVNAALVARSQRIGLSPRLIVYQHRAGLEPMSALKERVIWARSYAANRRKTLGSLRRGAYLALSPLLPIILLSRMTLNVIHKGRTAGAFARALPLTTCLTVAWAWGEMLGYLTGRPGGKSPSPHG